MRGDLSLPRNSCLGQGWSPTSCSIQGSYLHLSFLICNMGGRDALLGVMRRLNLSYCPGPGLGQTFPLQTLGRVQLAALLTSAKSSADSQQSIPQPSPHLSLDPLPPFFSNGLLRPSGMPRKHPSILHPSLIYREGNTSLGGLYRAPDSHHFL